MCSVERRRGARHRPRTGGCSSTPAPTATSTTFVSQPRDLRRHAGDRARRAARRSSSPACGIDDIDVVDLYSCFPSAVQIGAAVARARPRPPAHPHRRPVLRRRSVEQLRDARHRHGGERPARAAGRARAGVGQRRLRHQARVRRLLAPTPPASRVPPRAPAGRDRRACRAASSPTAADAAGPATIEAYTVMHDRDGAPETAIAACLLADGRRAWGTVDRPRPGRGDVRRRARRHRRHPLPRRHPPPHLTPSPGLQPSFASRFRATCPAENLTQTRIWGRRVRVGRRRRCRRGGPDPGSGRPGRPTSGASAHR